jgi:HPt (histidine-containing phosphotransfer) domain-containing protein
MKREVILDIKALHATADHDPQVERQLLVLFMGTAGRCLVRMQGLVVRADNREWQSIVHELQTASAHIHAKQLEAQCKHSVDVTDDAVSRMAAYLQIKEAYDGLLIYMKNQNLLMQIAQSGG